MNNNILLSIIIPVYNVEKYLEQCIDSILYQLNFKIDMVEIILIDDGSNDKSGTICDKYSNLYKYIKTYHKKNKGLSSARNYGLNKARGKYIWFIDSDDYICNDTLKIILNKLKNNTIDILLGDAYVVDDKGNFIKNLIHKGLKENVCYDGVSIIKNQIKEQNDYITVVWLGIYNRKFLNQKKLYFKENLIHEDELWSPITLVQSKKVIYLEKKIYNYRIRPNSIMRKVNTDNSKHITSLIYIFNNLPLYIEKLVKDKKIKQLINDNISKRYLHDIVYWQFYKFPEFYKKVNRCQIFINSITLKNKIRSLILLINRNLYSKLALKVGVKNEK